MSKQLQLNVLTAIVIADFFSQHHLMSQIRMLFMWQSHSEYSWHLQHHALMYMARPCNRFFKKSSKFIRFPLQLNDEGKSENYWMISALVFLDYEFLFNWHVQNIEQSRISKFRSFLFLSWNLEHHFWGRLGCAPAWEISVQPKS